MATTVTVEFKNSKYEILKKISDTYCVDGTTFVRYVIKLGLWYQHVSEKGYR